jgi:predicted nucleotidyltransferase
MASMSVLLPHPLSGLFDDRRARVLDALLAADGPLSGRDIAKRCGVSPTTAGDALDELADRGLVRVAPRGRALLWQLDEDHAFVRMVRDWTAGVDAAVAGLVADTLGETPESVVLFGSAARREDRPDSDVDVLVVSAGAEGRRGHRRRSYALAQSMRRLLGRPVDVVVMDREEMRAQASSPFVQRIAREGRVLVGMPIPALLAGAP